MLVLLSIGLLFTAAPAQDDGPEISDAGYCASIYGALARAQTRKAPKALRDAAGFATIDFAARHKSVLAKLPQSEHFAVTWWQQGFETAFDVAADGEAEGKVPDTALVTEALTKGRNCDKDHGFSPLLLDRVATSTSLPVEPYWCAVNYFTLGMGMTANPAAARQMQGKIQFALTKHDAAAFTDPAKGTELRERLRADAAERNRAVAAKQIAPEQLFATAQACDAMLAGAGQQ
jgi:hypothetical protein